MSQPTVGLTDTFVDLQHATDGTDTASSAQEYPQAYVEVGNEGEGGDDDPEEDDDTANDTHGPMREPFLQSTIQLRCNDFRNRQSDLPRNWCGHHREQCVGYGWYPGRYRGIHS